MAFVADTSCRMGGFSVLAFGPQTQDESECQSARSEGQPDRRPVGRKGQLLDLRASLPGLRASQPGLRASQTGLRTSQSGLRTYQPGSRASLFCCCYHSFYQKMSAFSLVCHLFRTGRCGRCQKNSYQYFVAVQCLSLFYHSLFFCFKGVWEYRQYHYVFKEFWD